MIRISDYISAFPDILSDLRSELPWNITSQATDIIHKKIEQLGSGYSIHNNVAIHKDALIEEHVILKGPIIISQKCFIRAHAYLRGGVFLDENVSIGPGCEVKSSFIMKHSALAHLNFVGDSMIGQEVNMEAGSVIANHYNERDDKFIIVMISGKPLPTGVTKFGALIGDHSRIGANAVLSPGSVLVKNSVVKRLELIQQGG